MEKKTNNQGEHLKGNLNFEDTPFKDSRGRYRTEGLFYELRRELGVYMYTLRDNDIVVDGVTIPSIKRLYLEEQDISELEFARKYFYNWKHWKVICNNKVILRHIEEWREELDVQLKSQALKSMINTALNEGSKGTAAARFLLEKGWLPKEAKATKSKVDKEKVTNSLHAEIGTFLQRVK